MNVQVPHPHRSAAFVVFARRCCGQVLTQALGRRVWCGTDSRQVGRPEANTEGGAKVLVF